MILNKFVAITIILMNINSMSFAESITEKKITINKISITHQKNGKLDFTKNQVLNNKSTPIYDSGLGGYSPERFLDPNESLNTEDRKSTLVTQLKLICAKKSVISGQDISEIKQIIPLNETLELDLDLFTLSDQECIENLDPHLD